MKKIIYFLTSFILVFSPLASVKADTITRSDLEVVAPSMISALNQLSTVINEKANKFNIQNQNFSQITYSIGSIVNTIANLKNTDLSQNDRLALVNNLDLFSNQLVSLYPALGSIAEERASFYQILNNINNILASLSRIVV